MRQWDEIVGKFTAECEYLSESHTFKVTVYDEHHTLTEEFKAQFEPKFGMDGRDLQESQMLAEKLATQIEEKNVKR